VSSLLDPLPDPAAEARAVAAARDDTERPGTWYGDEGADGRQLTQDLTDCLIRAELWHTASLGEKQELEGAIGKPRGMFVPGSQVFDGRDTRMWSQRGGIDSDPLVRLLAYRAWGERDRRWFEERGVRKGERVIIHGSGGVFAWTPDLAAWSPNTIRVALADAWPGQLVEVKSNTIDGSMIGQNRVGDRLRDEPADRPDPREDVPPIELLRGYLGFDELRIEYDPMKRWSVVAAVKNGVERAVFVTDQDRVLAGDPARLWRGVCWQLVRGFGLSELTPMRYSAEDDILRELSWGGTYVAVAPGHERYRRAAASGDR